MILLLIWVTQGKSVPSLSRVSRLFLKITDDGIEYRLEDAIGKPTGEDNGEVNGGDKSQTDRALAICIRKVRFEGKQ